MMKTLNINIALTLIFQALLWDGGGAAAVITNPYYSGCLREKLPDMPLFQKKRVCNSDDPPSAVSEGYCREPDFESYMEIRINAGNWNSPIIAAWLVQITLSEILGVPTSIEAGSHWEKRSFYDPESRIDYDTSSYVDFLAMPFELKDGDCRYASKDEADYQPCAHFNPEHWHVEHANVTRQLQEKGIDPPQNIGSLGHETWFITKFTVEEDPTLVSYMGLAGEKNRQKLANTFKRPTNWRDYCEIVSETNCTTPDAYAQRPPADENEAEKYFASGDFTGYFRATEKNNCTANPTNCTGHIANYPCDWPSYTESQLYHLNIALETNGPDNRQGGYAYSRLNELMHAANATKSNLMMMYWTPEPLYQQYLGTESELIQVVLKPQTQECVDARPANECAEDIEERVGPPEAACSQAPKPLQKMISNVLQQAYISPDIPFAIKSPAYEMLQGFQVREVQLNELFGLWSTAASPRDAVCEWAAEHLDFLLVNVPPTFPRVPEEKKESALSSAALAVAVLATISVLFTSLAVYREQNKDSIRYAQIEFLQLLLMGSLLITLGAILSSTPASNATCVAAIWLVNIGYTLELVPLIVKVAAINKVMSNAQRLRRMSLPRQQLYGAVAVICVICIIFLSCWTAFNAPHKDTLYALTDTVTDNGEYVVHMSYYCEDGLHGWKFLAVGWNAVLLLCASVLAFQSRNIIPTFNESQTLAILIYSHFVFVILRCTTYFLENQVDGTLLNDFRSLLYSVDTLATIVIYFVPKLRARNDIRSSVTVSGFNVGSGMMGPGNSSGISNSKQFRNTDNSSKAFSHGKIEAVEQFSNNSFGVKKMDLVDLHEAMEKKEKECKDAADVPEQAEQAMVLSNGNSMTSSACVNISESDSKKLTDVEKTDEDV